MRCSVSLIGRHGKFAKSNSLRVAPASSAIRYKNVLTSSGVQEDLSPYQGPPTEENNKLWDDLYNCENQVLSDCKLLGAPLTFFLQVRVSKIPMSDAAQLANKTAPIENDPGNYVVTIFVFHQLHCLVRKITNCKSISLG